MTSPRAGARRGLGVRGQQRLSSLGPGRGPGPCSGCGGAAGVRARGALGPSLREQGTGAAPGPALSRASGPPVLGGFPPPEGPQGPSIGREGRGVAVTRGHGATRFQSDPGPESRLRAASGLGGTRARGPQRGERGRGLAPGGAGRPDPRSPARPGRAWVCPPRASDPRPAPPPGRPRLHLPRVPPPLPPALQRGPVGAVLLPVRRRHADLLRPQGPVRRGRRPQRASHPRVAGGEAQLCALLLSSASAWLPPAAAPTTQPPGALGRGVRPPLLPTFPLPFLLLRGNEG